MYEPTDLKELESEFYALMEYQDEVLEQIDNKLEHIARVLERTEWKIKHFGEAWPEDV